MPPAHAMMIAVICLGWGANFFVSAVALRDFPAFLFTTLRLAVVLLCTLPWLRPIAAGQRARLVGVALLSGSVHSALAFSALRMAGDVSSVAITMQSYVPMSALLAVVLLGERLTLVKGLAIAMAFVGVLVLRFDPLALDAPGALAITLVAASTLAAGTTLARGLRDVAPLQLQAWTALLGLPVAIALTALFERGQLTALQTAPAAAWGGVVYSAVVASVLGHGLLYWLVQRHPIARVTPYLLLAPVVSVALGVGLWGDRPGPKLLLGGAMVLVGVLVVAVGGRRP